VQTAEGAIGAAQEMAQRILTLATQGANGTMGDSERVALRQEMRQLMSAIDSIGTRTKYSGITVFGNSALAIQGTNVSGDTISISATALANIGVGTEGASGTILAKDDGDWTNANNASTTGPDLMDAISDLTNTTLTATSMNTIVTKAGLYITQLSKQRSELGAIQNQIEYTVNNVSELSSNLTAARSNIQDTDYASETANLTKGQILQQAATAMLAQANQMPNVILSLLK